MVFNSETTVNYGMSVSDKEAFGQSLAHGINLGRQTSCLDKGSASNGNKRLTGSPPKTINKRKLMAKIDWHVLPCFINIGNAAILGLKKVLHSQTVPLCMLCSVWSQSVKVSYQTGRTNDYSLVSLHVRKWLVSWRTAPPVPNILIQTGLYLIGWMIANTEQTRSLLADVCTLDRASQLTYVVHLQAGVMLIFAVGGIISIYSFLTKHAPRCQRDRAIEEGNIDLQELSQDKLEYMGDLAPTFRSVY
ncbi:hypothetical protein Y699_07526 [Aspergillus fumigatus Z5]|nr:hypothetical protein Y699_07526 [Aspergillus fumigatus Z5]